MKSFQRTVVSFAGSSVAVEVNDPRAADIVQFLIHPSLIDPTRTPHCIFRICVEEKSDLQYILYQDEKQICRHAQPGQVAENLQSALCHQLADQSRDGLLFHAAALVDGSHRGILIPGGIGAGKSTLTTWLLSKGLGYLTDELVYVPWGSQELVPYPRPLHLKLPSRPVLEAENLSYQHQEGVYHSQISDMVPARIFTPLQVVHPVPLEMVLFPRYQSDHEFHGQTLSPAQIGQYLMQTLINARNLPDHGFHETSRLARSARGYALVYGHFKQIEAHLTDILNLSI